MSIKEDGLMFSLNKCRICLKSGEIFIPGIENLLEQVIEFGGVKITEDDLFPKHLCDSCYSLLKAALLFRQKAQNSERILNYKKMTLDSEVASSDSKSSADEEDLHNFNEHSQTYRKIQPKLQVWENDCNDKFSGDESTSRNGDFQIEDELESSGSEREYLEINDDTDDFLSTNVMCVINQDSEINLVSNKDNENYHIEQYQCGMCSMISETLDKLEIHCELNHNIKVTDTMKCDVCKEDVSVAIQHIHMKQHKDEYKRKRRKVGKIECNICKKYIMKTYIKYHMKMHGPETERAERKKYCRLCQKPISLHYFVSHLRRVHQRGPNEEKIDQANLINVNKDSFENCPICEKLVHKSKYKEHLADHGKPPKKYVCEYCAKEFRYQSAFKTHQLTHTDEFKYQCQFCPYKAQYLGLIKVHVRTHTGDYNYKCPHCPSKFITKSNLNQHIQRHNVRGNIKCHTCNKYFYRKSNMEKHYSTKHLGVRDVICDMCGTGFSHRDEMLSHQLRMHNRERLLRRVPTYLRVAREKEKDEIDIKQQQLQKL